MIDFFGFLNYYSTCLILVIFGGIYMKRNLLPFIQTKDSDITDEELRELIEYAILKSGYLENEDLYKANCYSDVIIFQYHQLCSEINKKYVFGLMDTFLRAACLMCACATYGVFRDKNTPYDANAYYNCRIANAAVGIEAALSWIQRPSRYVGENCDQLDIMQECDFEVAFSNDSSFIEDRKQAYQNILKYYYMNNNEPDPISLGENLHCVYEAALISQYGALAYGMNMSPSTTNISNDEIEENTKQTLFQKLKSIFNK